METQTLVKEICPTSTQKWIGEGALLVDVREKDEVNQLSYDVPEIMQLPLSEFENRYSEIPKDRKVVMVCRSGGRSLREEGFLVKYGNKDDQVGKNQFWMINHGYHQVVNMQFGIIRWVQKGFPTKGDTSSVLPKDSDCCSKPGCC